jgi:enoyl-CoA hydratase
MSDILTVQDGPIFRITLNRPERGNGITLDLPVELAQCVERADLDPAVHVIALSGNGKGFCGGYDLVASAERMSTDPGPEAAGTAARATRDFAPAGSPLDPRVTGRNHDPRRVWDPVIDYQMMSRNVRGFMSLFHANKPVVCKVHGFCVAGGTEILQGTDIRVAGDTAIFGVTEAKRGLFPLGGSTVRLRRQIPYTLAAEILLTARHVTAQEAREFGLISKPTVYEDIVWSLLNSTEFAFNH